MTGDEDRMQGMTSSELRTWLDKEREVVRRFLFNEIGREDRAKRASLASDRVKKIEGEQRRRRESGRFPAQG